MNIFITTREALAREIERFGWSVGEHSYGVPLVLEDERGMLTIGRFCSIALGVTMILDNHRTDLVSTYPFKALAAQWPEAADAPDDHENRGGIEIGSDVWLGAHCTIVPGVRIGSGAIIAAGCVVTRNVPPYAIVAGNPGRVVRARCTDEEIRDLLEIAWWDWPDDKIRRELPEMMRGSVAAFVRTHRPAR